LVVTMNARENYLEKLKSRLRGEPEAPTKADAPTLAIAAPEPPEVVEDAPAPDVAQPSAYSESTPVHRVDEHLATELGAIVTELSRESLEVLVVVARRLARAEERA
jgi:hypothetical protein